ncbi:hypothetical protein [Pantoea stewartii]|uniref:hypothetical protein n=1 Tax=Pantoea stewartii TaxID=66269 RepID=UPI002DBAD010|nr:hypothetical protein [Pantoea stewartii]
MPYILTHFLTVADFPRQAITGKFTDQLLIKANGVDVAGAVMQPRELLFSWQGKMNEIAGRIPS